MRFPRMLRCLEQNKIKVNLEFGGSSLIQLFRLLFKMWLSRVYTNILLFAALNRGFVCDSQQQE